MSGRDRRPDPDDLEPLLDTKVLDMWAEANAPLRGRIRQRVLDKTRLQLKERRTVQGVANRVSNLAVTPVTTAMREEAEEETREAIEKFLERRANND
jgi:hypothetical protein